MLWIEDIVESTQAPIFMTNSKVGMASFVDPHTVVVRRNAFWTLPSAWNEVESKGEVESGRLKHQFSQIEGNLDFKKILKLVPIQRKEH